jgi:hypothetical protein
MPGRIFWHSPARNREKALANQLMNAKRMEDINADKIVPGKTKIAQGKNQAQQEDDSSAKVKAKRRSPRRSTASQQRREPGKGKKMSVSAEAQQFREPSDEEIRVRAYFISERRRRFALPGDAESDWLEARRQLLREAGPR